MKKDYITFLKFISMIFVLLAHCLSRAWNNLDVNSDMFKYLTFIACILRTNVPIFAMCSGAIFLNRSNTFKNILFKCLRIYFYFVVFNSLYKFIDFIIYGNGIISLNSILYIVKDSLLLKSIYHLWYLKIVLILYISIPLFKFFINKEKNYINHLILIVLITLFVIIPLITNNTLYFHFYSLFGYLIYFYLGYYLEHYKFKYEEIFFFVLYIISLFYTYLNTIKLSVLLNAPNEKYFFNLYPQIIIMSCFVFIFFSKFNYSKIKKFLNIESKHNFNIYLFHGLVIGLLQYIKIIDIYHYNNIFFLFINTIIVLLFSYIISILFNLFISFLNKLKKPIIGLFN